jgi:group I intron endonuclease
MNYIIYKYTSKTTGKSYIGQTNNPEKRMTEHKRANRGFAFSNAIKKHGWDDFEYTVVENGLSINDANEKEEHYISHYNTLSPNGYNLKSVGKNGKLSEETKEKIRASNIGLKRSEEAKANVSASQQNRSLETRIKMGIAHKGKKFSEERRALQSKNLMGRPVSETTRIKQKESAKKRGVSKQTRTKIRVSKETNYAIKIGRELSLI